MTTSTGAQTQLSQALSPAGRAGTKLAPETAQTLQRAAATSGTPFATLVSIASSESNFSATAQNKRSSAAGAFQITDTTWMHLLKRYGAAFGRGDLAKLVSEDSAGRLSVAPQDRAAVFAARQDMDLSSKLAARYCDECRSGLNKKLGRAPSETEVRMGYFLGVTGASRLIKGAETSPDASVKSLLPGAYASNRSIFSAHGKPLTTAQSVAALEKKFSAEINRSGAVPAPAAKPATNSLIAAMIAGQPSPAAGEIPG